MIACVFRRRPGNVKLIATDAHDRLSMSHLRCQSPSRCLVFVDRGAYRLITVTSAMNYRQNKLLRQPFVWCYCWLRLSPGKSVRQLTPRSRYGGVSGSCDNEFHWFRTVATSPPINAHDPCVGCHTRERERQY